VSAKLAARGLLRLGAIWAVLLLAPYWMPPLGGPASVAMAKIEAIKARMRISGQLSGIRYQNRAGSAPAPLITDC